MRRLPVYEHQLYLPQNISLHEVCAFDLRIKGKPFREEMVNGKITVQNGIQHSKRLQARSNQRIILHAETNMLLRNRTAANGIKVLHMGKFGEPGNILQVLKPRQVVEILGRKAKPQVVRLLLSRRRQMIFISHQPLPNSGRIQ